jgi:hypothetical protein
MCGLFAGLACGCKYTAIPLIALPLGLAIVFRAIADCFAFPPIACAPGSDGEAVSYQLSAVSRTSRTPTLLSLLATRYSKLFAFPPVACAPGSDSLRACILFGFGAILTFGPWLARNVAFCGNPVFPLATKTVGWRGEIWSDESAARWDAGHRPPAHARSLGGRVQAVWGGVIAHPRTGPALWLLGAAAVVLAPRAAWPWAVMLIVQLAGWAGLTHLVDRMAVPVLPVLFVLGARLAEDRRTAVRSAAFGVALLGAALNLYRVQGLYYDHARVVEENGRTARLGLHGQTAWFVEGQWPGTAHLGFINRELSADARILMVADARPFYVRRWCEACVVFNPNPLAAAVRDSRDAAAVLEWLRSTGYTHVYVDRVEMRRLRATYGFWPEIDEALFDRLERAGLKRIQDFTFGPGGPTYGTIYEVGK